MMKSKYWPPIFSFFMLLCGCVLKDEKPVETFNSSVNMIASGDIVVINTPNDAILLLDKDGSYKTTLVDENDPGSIILGGLTYDSVDKRLLYTYDHSLAALDSIMGIDLYNGRTDLVLNNNNLSGVLTYLARLTAGDYLVLESGTSAEKFNSAFVRQGAPFTSALTNAIQQLEPLAAGGFLACSSATATTVRTYTVAGATVATATSASPTPSLGALGASGCIERPDGTIVVTYSGGGRLCARLLV